MNIHVVDLQCRDESSSQDTDEPNWKCTDHCVVRLFGRMRTNESVTVSIHDYRPYFYVRIPDKIQSKHAHLMLKSALRKAIRAKHRTCFSVFPQVYHKECLRGFQNNLKHNFLKITFTCCSAFYAVTRAIKESNWLREQVILMRRIIKHLGYKTIDGLKIAKQLASEYNMILDNKNKPTIAFGFLDGPVDHTSESIVIDDTPSAKAHLDALQSDRNRMDHTWKLYQPNLSPVLTFIHDTDIQPCGIVAIKSPSCDSDIITTTDHNYTCPWHHVSKTTETWQASLIEASYDIEANSSHGLFPSPKKTYDQLAKNAIEHYRRLFKRHKAHKSSKQIKTNSPKPPDMSKRPVRLGLLKKFLQEAIGTWYPVDYTANAQNASELPPHRMYLKKPLTKRMINTLLEKMPQWLDGKIMGVISGSSKVSKTIEEIDQKFSKIFPGIHGDECIGIGTTYRRYGQDTCHRKVYYGLLGHAPLEKHEGELVWFDTEAELLIAWADLIRETDPDILVGYNINKFDYLFMYERAQELGIVSKFARLSRLALETGKLILNKFKQSHIIEMPGRVSIDLCQVLIDDFADKLSSYTLNNVAVTYINGGIKSSKMLPEQGVTRIMVSSVGELTPGGYIMIMGNVGAHTETVYMRAIGSHRDHREAHLDPLNASRDPLKAKLKSQETHLDPLSIHQDHQGAHLDPLNASRDPLKAKLKSQETHLDPLSIHQDHQDETISTDPLKKFECVNMRFIKRFNYNPLNIKFQAHYIKTLPKPKTPKALAPLKNKFRIASIGPDYIDIEGLYDIDLSNYLSCKWCECKDDLTPDQLFAYFRKTPTHRRIIGKYCIQDCELVSRLMYKRMVLVNHISMANVCLVPLQFLFTRGQGVKVFSLVAKKCNDNGYLIPLVQSCYFPKDQSYDGAIVLDPKKGIYTRDDEIIVVLDFASLYPSCMIADDICISNIILNPKYDNIPGVTYNTIEYPTYKIVNKKKIPTGTEVVRYANHVRGRKGILPRILEELLGERRAVKRMMAAEKNPMRKSVLDGRQLALKITANSVYGQTGARTSPICCFPVAASITAKGRHELLFARDYTLEHYEDGCDCVYGDSVADDSMVYVIYRQSMPMWVRVSDVAADEPWHRCACMKGCTKEYYDLDGVMVRSINGFTKAYRIIRHRAHKPMYRVQTRQAHVDVTSDHSMVLEDGGVVRPVDLEVGSRLMTIHDYCAHDLETDGTVVSVEPIAYDVLRYVYDFTTSDHHFAVGDIVVHNTDSIFVKPPRTLFAKYDTWADKMRHAILWALELGKEITSHLKPPHDLEFEKAISPFILYIKKRYVGRYYTDADNLGKNYINSMGIELKRRDNAPILKEIYGNIIKTIMLERDVEKTKVYFDEALRNLVSGNIPLDKFIVTKRLNGFYKKPERHAHRVLADRMAERDPGSAPKPGERVQYAVVETERPEKRMGNRVEHPDYIKKHGLKLDYLYYIENQLLKPVGGTYALEFKEYGSFDDPKFLKSAIEQAKRLYFDKHIRDLENKRAGQQTITSFFGGAKKLEGSHRLRFKKTKKEVVSADIKSFFNRVERPDANDVVDVISTKKPKKIEKSSKSTDITSFFKPIKKMP